MNVFWLNNEKLLLTFQIKKVPMKPKFPTDSKKGRNIWRCTTCNYCRSDFAGSIFENSKIAKNVFLQYAWCWLQEMPPKYITKITGIANSTCGEWNRLLMEAIQISQLEKPFDKIGGPGVIVEIDESKFGKRKYNVSDKNLRCQNVFIQ